MYSLLCTSVLSLCNCHQCACDFISSPPHPHPHPPTGSPKTYRCFAEMWIFLFYHMCVIHPPSYSLLSLEQFIRHHKHCSFSPTIIHRSSLPRTVHMSQALQFLCVSHHCMRYVGVCCVCIVCYVPAFSLSATATSVLVISSPPPHTHTHTHLQVHQKHIGVLQRCEFFSSITCV